MSIIFLYLVLKDGLFENQTPENFAAVSGPKAGTTQHLDKLTREVYGDRELWFVVFSSQSCSRGTAGQTNYGYANSAMERICERRRSDGFHGLAIQWGWIGDVGYVVKSMTSSTTGHISCFAPQCMASCLEALDSAMTSGYSVVGSFVKQQREGTERKKAVKPQSVTEKVLKLLGVKNSLNDSLTLQEVGIDSIMTVEVKHLLERDANVVLSNKTVRNMTFLDLKKIDASLASGDTENSTCQG
ncbi:fatty acid synthase-like [Physella acuta]|uniref:fatty acid synthase-like n=1 Tax=Physella acuta TaxID=109671 RepID=UPI0027DB5950|nr:fatty acid synthase-like [Physella acuta]